ncbi:hypothetical protein [uncultured Campylobacter sp.]|uniref:hypothetical protein n=1 Tax=uncultured Campylobacter sp. TaxID=218934 RepID=UPI00260CDFA8|nr:hypothetical protein [uncultured Campylobacter sp.]
MRYAPGRYLLACGFCKRHTRALNLTLVAVLFLNLNFVLADLLLNFIIAVLPIKFCRHAGLALKARGCDAKRGQIL